MAELGSRSTAEALLGVLSLGPKSGYEVRKFMEGSTANFWTESFGQIYPALKKLEAAGMIETLGSDGEGHPAKKRYKITQEGSTRLREWLGESPKPRVPRNELLLKLFFGVSAQPGEMVVHIEEKRTQAEADLARYEPIIAELEAEYGKRSNRLEHPGLPYWLMTLKCGIAEATATIAWCETTLKELKKLDDTYRKRSAQRV